MSATALDTTMATVSLIASSPAKLNLTLEVLGPRDDGFHEIRSLVVGVDLCDRVRCCASPGSGVTIECNEATLQGDDNLACRAANKLAHRLQRRPAVRIELEKRIPVAAGLGGGSSNAATALRLCNELWAGGLGPEELASIGAGVVGSGGVTAKEAWSDLIDSHVRTLGGKNRCNEKLQCRLVIERGAGGRVGFLEPVDDGLGTAFYLSRCFFAHGFVYSTSTRTSVPSTRTA